MSANPDWLRLTGGIGKLTSPVSAEILRMEFIRAGIALTFEPKQRQCLVGGVLV